MGKEKLDCRGCVCPVPVIMTKKELEKPEVTELEVIVDNEAAKENLIKLAQSMNRCVEVKQKKSDFVLHFGEVKKRQIPEPDLSQESEMRMKRESAEVVLITSEFLGSGDETLGRILMKGFLFTLSETLPYPKKILFLNGGVKLTATNPEAIANLKKLEEEGVEILSCGTCLDYYQIKEKLGVGKIANMYDIVESLKSTTDKWTL
ncbi:MAG: sulfurtransferase-like selenium metabolism protein YedF [Peptostreptococcaceae bacterium]|nr:sulfurtransferase-like selenium metabolism protein YedF [Peptostreptococcaceae bacterium]